MLDELKVQPDFIILDLNLPQFSGLEFLERYPHLLGSPVVVYTSSENPADRERAFQLGVVEYVTKPAGFDETISTVCQLMERLVEKGASQGACTNSRRRSVPDSRPRHPGRLAHLHRRGRGTIPQASAIR
jgi:DNA-binding response OmpR family regulator